MNRIYQGRVSSLQIIDPSGTPRQGSIGDPATCPLWGHHRIFQDAVNYYLLAFGALASADAAASSRVILDLRTRLAESWESFPRPNSRGKRGLRDSCRSWLGLGGDATIDEAFAKILDGSEVEAAVRNLALAALFAACGGESAIQQAGRGYFPRLCWQGYQGSFDFSSEAKTSAGGKDRLAAVLHGDSSPDALRQLAAEMDLSWTVKVQPGRFFEGAEAVARVQEALDHLAKMVEKPSARLAMWLQEIADPAAEIVALRGSLMEMGEDLRIPRNRKAAPDLTFSSIAFMVFPCQLTRYCLRQGVKEPGKLPKKKVPSIDFSEFGDDPLKLARGQRGYVFRAFTALPAWGPVSPGEPAWKEFDIAAFKEALKALNQFNQKTEEREVIRLELEARRAWMLGTGGHGGDEEEKLPVLGGDPRFQLAMDLEKDLTERLMLDASNPFTISRASLRGFRDLAEKWNQAKSSDPEKLQAIVKAYQADPKNQREIGSVPLMLALCETDYHSLWREADEEERQRREDGRRPADMLLAMCRLHQLHADLKSAGQPIRLTPAEPEASRRLYMFSDLSGRSAPKFRGTDTVEVSLAVQQEGAIREARAMLHYSAPRLKRDELTGGEASRWVQPMTAALKLGSPPSAGAFESAVALMPGMIVEDNARKVRHLLNFPVSIEPAWLHEALGKALLWKGQFNGTKESNLHLHWPSTEKEATRKNRWWENPAVIEKGFTVLSNDLGQRSAGAWALLRVTCWKPETMRPVREVGNDGSRTWFAEVFKTGMHRLPGEEALELKGAERNREPYGSKGRLPTVQEHAAAIRIAADLGIREPERWLGELGQKSFPELNDDLLKIANRRLSRLGTYHRWSCFDPAKIDVEAKREKAVENLKAELDSYQDEEVQPWKELAAAGDFAAFQKETGRAFVNLRDHIERVLVNLANLTVPVRRKLWEWRMRGGESVYGDLILEEFTDSNPKVRGQRGLSMKRLEQLENLRRVFLRYNRSLDRTAGEPAKFGREDRGRESGEPCQELLEKIERMKEQRVNQTAHLILAQALGVRLKAHSLPDRETRDIHGEYEKIEGREPVDFIVIEDLNRYKASQGRAPSENRGLMKWAHRAVRDKLKMLSEEPFGIPVVEVAAAYTSRFCGRTGESGARCLEVGLLQGYELAALQKKSDQKPSSGRTDLRAQFKVLLEQFATIKEANAAATEWNKRRERGAKARPIGTLLLPRPGGPLFLNIRDGQPVQADLNAAINIGLRAIAAPGSMDLIHRVRGIREGGQADFTWRPRHSEKEQANARERAAFDKASSITLSGDLSSRFLKTSLPNFFFEKSPSFTLDTGTLIFQGRAVPVISGIALHSQCDGFVLDRILEINNGRLKAWGLSTVPITSKCTKRLEASKPEDPDDEIPI
jgi:IS605 OrfB family transposase